MVDVRTQIQRMWARCKLVLNDTSTKIVTLLLLQDTFAGNPSHFAHTFILFLMLPDTAYKSCAPSRFFFFDIDPNEEATHHYGPPINRTIEFRSDDKAIMLSRFSQTDLLRIYACFNMPHIVRINNGKNCNYLMT